MGTNDANELGRDSAHRGEREDAAPTWAAQALRAAPNVLWRWHATTGELEWGLGAEWFQAWLEGDLPQTLGELGQHLREDDGDHLVRTFLEALNQQQPLHLKVRPARADRATYRLTLYGSPVTIDHGIALAGQLLAEDIGVTESASDPTPWLGGVLEDLKAGTLDLDLRTGTIRADERLVALFDLDPELVTSFDGFVSLIHPDDRARAVEVFEDFLRSGRETYATEYRVRNRKLHDLWLECHITVVGRDDQGAPLRVFTVLRDVTDQKLADIQRREVENRFRTMFQAAPLGIIYASLQEPVILDANPAFCRISGYEAHELQGMPVSQTWPPEAWNAERYMVVMERARRGEVDQAHWMRPLLRKDGKCITVRMSGGVVTDHQGRPAYAIGMFEDITERHQEDEAIRRSEERFRSLIEDTADIIIVTDEMLRVCYASPAAERLFGHLVRPSVFNDEAGVGTGILRTLLPSHISRTLQAIKDATASVDGIASLSVQARDVDLRLRDLDLTVRNALGRDGIRGIVFSVRDVTDQRRAEAATQRQLLRLRSLHMIDMAINAGIDIRMTLGVVLDTVLSHLTVEAAVIRVMASPGLDLEEHGHRGQLEMPPRRIIRVGEGLAGRAVIERRRLEQGIARLVEIGAEGDSRGDDVYVQTAVPLIAKGQVQGVLQLWTRATTPMGEEDAEFVETLAGQTAIAIDNAHLFESLQRSNDEVLMAYDATIEGWSQALDLRDKETEGHTRRVTEMTLRLARAMGMNDAELLHVRRGCLLHDIGKMGVPDRILLKPGPLDAEEWKLMRLHPVHAYEWLSPIQFLQPALAIPYAHHEKWDGSGYPRGLVGEEIPQAARIFAVIDVFDALSSDRPYRPAVPIPEVLAHIQANAGTHFDPLVVQEFLSLWREDAGFRASCGDHPAQPAQ